MNGAASLRWGDGEYQFLIRYGEIYELQKVCDAGPDFIVRRIASIDWRPSDVRETLRLALIGVGMSAYEANLKIKKYVEESPKDWDFHRMLACALITEAIRPPGDENSVGKALEAWGMIVKAPSFQEVKSPSRDSTELGGESVDIPQSKFVA